MAIWPAKRGHFRIPHRPGVQGHPIQERSGIYETDLTEHDD